MKLSLKKFFIQTIALYFLFALFSLAYADMNKAAQYYEQKKYKAAFNEFLIYAKAGNHVAQTIIGNMYDNGQGVVQDYKSAHMWFNIAGANGEKLGIKGRDIVAKLMTPAQIDAAQKMAQEWMKNHP